MGSTVVVKFLGDTSGLKGAIGDAEGKLGGFGSKAAGILKSVAGPALVAGAGAFLKGAIDAANESIRVANQTDAVLKSTGGAAGVTADHVGKLAHQLQGLSGVSDENIQTGQNMLLTFTGIRNEVGKGNDIFDQATKTMLDMSVATGTDAKGAALQLGKALNDPVAGISKLTKVGVTFTDQQKAQIKAMTEAGDKAGAQKVILAELNREFGGSAKAAGDAMTPMQKLGLAFGDLQETVGTKLLPVITGLVDFFASHQEVLVAIAGAVGVGLVGAFAAWTASLWAAVTAEGAVLAPVIAIGVAIAALAAGVIYAYQHWDAFRNVVDAVAHFLTDTVWPAIQLVAGGIVAAFEAVVSWFQTNWSTISTVVGGVFEVIRTIFETYFTVYKTIVETVLGAIQAVWHAVGDDIQNYIGGVFSVIRSIVQGAMDVIHGIINTVTALIRGDWGAAWDGIKQIVSGILDAIKGVISGALDAYRALLGGLASIVSGAFHAAWDGASSIVKSAVDAAVGFAASLPGRVVDAIMALAQRFLDLGRVIAQKIVDGVKEGIKSLPGIILGAIPGVNHDGSITVDGTTYGPGGAQKRAMGGPVSGGKPYLVGEQGPELFVPGGAGGIVPNNQLERLGPLLAAIAQHTAATARSNVDVVRRLESLERRFAVGMR